MCVRPLQWSGAVLMQRCSAGVSVHSTPLHNQRPHAYGLHLLSLLYYQAIHRPPPAPRWFIRHAPTPNICTLGRTPDSPPPDCLPHSLSPSLPLSLPPPPLLPRLSLTTVPSPQFSPHFPFLPLLSPGYACWNTAVQGTAGTTAGCVSAGAHVRPVCAGTRPQQTPLHPHLLAARQDRGGFTCLQHVVCLPVSARPLLSPGPTVFFASWDWVWCPFGLILSSLHSHPLPLLSICPSS